MAIKKKDFIQKIFSPIDSRLKCACTQNYFLLEIFVNIVDFFNRTSDRHEIWYKGVFPVVAEPYCFFEKNPSTGLLENQEKHAFLTHFFKSGSE
jgi:hypothetical protein